MNKLDIIIVVVFVLSTTIGVWRGFVKEALSLGTWVVASAVAWLLADVVADVFSRDIVQPALRLVAAFVVIFIVTYLLGTIITHFLNKMLTRKPALQAYNTMFGAGLGAMRAAVIVIIGFLLAGLVPAIPASDWWQDSGLAPGFESAARFSSDFLPRDIARHIDYD